MFKEDKAISSVLTFEEVCAKFYITKFKAKEELSELINALTEYKILATPKCLNPQTSFQVKLYQCAKKECLHKILSKLNMFQKCVQTYELCLEKASKVEFILQSVKEPLEKEIQVMSSELVASQNTKAKSERKRQGKCGLIFRLQNLPSGVEYLQGNSQLSWVSLVYMILVFCLTKQFSEQLTLIQKECQSIWKLFQGNDRQRGLNPQTVGLLQKSLEVTLMHVSYETCIDNQHREQWNQNLLLLNSKRSNAF